MVGLTRRLLGGGVLQMSSFFFAISSGQVGESLLMGNGKLCWHSPQRHNGRQDWPRLAMLLPAALTLPRQQFHVALGHSPVTHQVCKSTAKPKTGDPSPRAQAPLLHKVFGQAEVLNKSNRL